jgi:hypothetical protein
MAYVCIFKGNDEQMFKKTMFGLWPLSLSRRIDSSRPYWYIWVGIQLAPLQVLKDLAHPFFYQLMPAWIKEF